MNNKILIVDDNPKNLQVLAALLAENNYSVEVALNGKSAIKWLQVATFDAILMDVMMPEINGFETCETIKKDARHADIPVIFLTARTDVESVTEGFERGGVDFITKPFNQKELLARLSTHIELKKSREKILDLNGWLSSEVEKKTEELNESYQRLKEANENLKQLDVAKNDFLNSISHELRTPLNGIMGSINLLNTYTHDKHIQEIVTLLDSSVSNLEKYSYAALQISNLQLKGISQLKLERLDMLPLIQSIVSGFSEKVKAKNIQCRFTMECIEAIAEADREFIQNALCALLDCSMIFTRKGFIKVIVSCEEKQIKVKIVDTGSPYEGKELNHFFKSVSNQNYTFERNNAMELYLARMIILLHNGTLEFGNMAENAGTVTTVYLPCKMN
ncbi:two-component system, unclassified family, sensor histidine kinase and response regulator [Saccharicrinis carchari]|uniref:histidine kinase n=1 Tax=Saccharicrinis carchari TaxID=1168039 RepID=A0A521EU43_SACCC|nr:hybrid sensor histidine kinase/response regulator [Saccharicrinis carchari]SMO87424.1 two-component system, unclassified family, sensor histidine kinase and response regulator [Saccharicrinis carchari]